MSNRVFAGYVAAHLVLLFLLLTAFFLLGQFYEREQNAAYLEGRYNLDRATAIRLADEK